MSCLNYVIIEAEQAYNNEVELSSGINIVVNTTIESVENINRRVKVVKAPNFTILKEGDELIIHHNILRLRNGQNGNLIQSNYHIEGNKYFVPLTEIFMYKRDDSDWKALDPYCFIKPIKADKVEKIGSIMLSDSEASKFTHKGMEKLTGVMSYPNQSLIDMGVNKGDTILFSDYSEYEFMIDGELYYKMSTKDVIAKVL